MIKEMMVDPTMEYHSAKVKSQFQKNTYDLIYIKNRPVVERREKQGKRDCFKEHSQ